MRAWTSTQATVALSSAEAELVALVRASTEALGFSQMCSEFRVPVQCQVFVDSSAALGVVSRKGCGRVRHLKLGHLWVQEVAHRGELAYHKVGGDSNVADLMTKHLKSERVRDLTQQIGCSFRTGSAQARLQLAAYLFGPPPPGDGPRRGACSCSQPWVSQPSKQCAKHQPHIQQCAVFKPHLFSLAICAQDIRVASRQLKELLLPSSTPTFALGLSYGGGAWFLVFGAGSWRKRPQR